MRENVVIRNFVFGVEDSLVSTVGFISGIATTSFARPTLLLTGLVLIVVEAFSMAMGSFLSDESAREYQRHTTVRARPSVIGGIVMLMSYLGAGLLVLAPYMILPPAIALGWSIGVSLASLFLLGVVSAYIAGLPVIRRGMRMAFVGGVAIVIGILASRMIGPSIGLS